MLPKLEPYVPEPSEVNVDAGKLVANKRGSGQELLALRAYRVNDDMRRVDWKATARTNEIVVREFSAEDDKKVTIYFDPRVPQNPKSQLSLRAKIEAEQSGKDVVRSERLERGVSLTGALINDFTDDQAEIRLAIGKEIGEYGIGSRHLYDCLKRLALIDPKFIDRNTLEAISPEVIGLFDETEMSHNYIVAAIGETAFPAEALQEAVFVRY